MAPRKIFSDLLKPNRKRRCFQTLPVPCVRYVIGRKLSRLIVCLT